jgi:hypothetical protein
MVILTTILKNQKGAEAHEASYPGERDHAVQNNPGVQLTLYFTKEVSLMLIT